MFFFVCAYYYVLLGVFMVCIVALIDLGWVIVVLVLKSLFI